MNRIIGLIRCFTDLAAKRVVSRLFGLPERRTVYPNAMFNKSNLHLLKREKIELESFDTYLHMTLNSRRLLGQIVFEYGTLLNVYNQWEGAKVLDVGTGRSTLPHWMASRGAHVTMFEHPSQVEDKIVGKLGWLNGKLHGKVSGRLEEGKGDLLSLPYRTDSFDLVTSFSVLEHLDTELPGRNYIPYPEQKKRLARALDEMIRVARPGGHIYITSECCDYRKAHSDAWRPNYYYKSSGPELSSAWPVEEVTDLFYRYLTDHGCEAAGPNTFNPADIEKPDFTTFRGPFFSGFCVFFVKK